MKNHQVLLTQLFKYINFESRTQVFFEGLPKKMSSSCCLGLSTQSFSSTLSCTSREDTIWQVHSFLDLLGKCHHCKKRYGNSLGSCLLSLNRAYVEIPPSFVTLPKPANYKPPKAWSPLSFGAGRVTQFPAGCAPSKALVSVIEDKFMCPDLDSASVTAFAAIDKKLCLSCKEQYVSPAPPDRIILLLQCGDTNLRGLVNTGSEINLISNDTVQRANLNLQPLSCPTKVNLALDDKLSLPYLLRHFVSTTLIHASSSSTFPDVSLREGPLKGRYVMILGIPLLACFDLSVSITSRCLMFENSTFCLFDFCYPDIINIQLPSVASLDTSSPYETIGRTILHDYSNLFPVDIPAVSDDAESEGRFVDGTFPDKFQNADLQVRHKIILTDPDAIINKCQYYYPQKHLTSWSNLLNQHVDTGQLQRLSSQYASPSMIIPKKDPSALPQRVCDYWVLSRFTVKDKSTLPNVDELIRTVSLGKIFLILGQTNAFF